jgi:hypothetical protein
MCALPLPSHLDPSAFIAVWARPWLLTAVWPLIRGLAWTLALMYVLMTVGVWAATLRTLGLGSLRQCPRMLRLSLRAAPVRELLVAILLPLLLLPLLSASGVGAGLIRELPLGALALIASLCLTLFLVPPTVLVFSSSTDRQLRWALALKRFTAGRRVITLLDTGYMTVAPRVGDVWSVLLRRSGTLTDVLRTSDADEWREGVQELIELSPVVVVDTRVCTRALLFEADAALSPGSAHKAVFVSEEDGRLPLLEGLLEEGGTDPRTPLCVVKEDELGALLGRLLTKGNLPKQGRFISTPSTLAEIVAGRGAKRGAEPRPPSHTPRDGAAVGPYATTRGRRRLSTVMTPFWRLAAKGAVVSLVLSAAFGLWMIFTSRVPWGFGPPTVCVLLACNVAGCVTLFHLCRRLKTVCIEGGTLFVSDHTKECEIYVSQISRVSGPDWTTLRRITLHLQGPSVFGPKIIFAGRLFSAGRISRELRQMVYRGAEDKAKLSLG